MKKFLLLISLLPAIAINLQAQVTVSGAASGNTSYGTLKAAFDIINGSGQSGRNIVITITGNTTEAATATLNAGLWTSLKIYPTTTGLSISGSISAAPLIDFNGADNVILDGRVNQTGSSVSLTIKNTSTSSSANTSTIRFINDATQNNVKYCNLLGGALNSSTTAGGIVLFSTTSGTTGNDFNSIDNNNITNAGGSRPRMAVCSIGTSAKENNYDHITNNNFYDLLNLGSDVTYDINVYSNSFGFDISNNNFYETSNLVPSSNLAVVVINVNAGDGHTVSGNYIGGTAAACGGSALTKTNAFSNNFTGINLNVGNLTANTIQGNTIKNINWSSATTFMGIYLPAGTANIGSSTGNIIGASTGTGSITTSSGTFYGIYIGSVSTASINISNNTVGSISQTGDFYGIKVVDGDNIVLNANIIGSSSTSNSVSLSAPSNVYGIICEPASSNNRGNITSNTVANLTVTATGSITAFTGISVKDKIDTIIGNSVNTLTASSSTITQNLTGIYYYNSSGADNISRDISRNTIYGLSSTSGSYTSSIYGISFYHNANSRPNIARNFIYNLSTSTSSASINIYGILLNSPSYVKTNNNIITLSPSSNVTIAGICDNAGASWLYYNTIYIGGTPTSGSAGSYAYLNTNLATKNYRDNIFENVRSNSGTASGKHYSISLANNSALTSDYNDYYVTGTGGVLGRFNGSDVSTLASWRTSTGQDVNSVNTNPAFGNPGGTIAYDYMPGVTLTGTDITGTEAVSIDYTAATRVVPVTMGAFEGYPWITSFTPTSAGTGMTVTISGAGFTGTTLVSFGGASAQSFTVVNSTTITAVISAGASGNVRVVNAQGDGYLAGFTYVSAPSTQAYNIGFASTTNLQTSISWVNGNGSARVVFLKATNSGSASPVNGTTYTANTAFGSGTQILASGWFCVFNGTGNTVTVTGLTPGTDYRAMVCEYNGSNGGQMYNTSTATNNPGTITTLSPTISVAGGFSTFSGCFGTASSSQYFNASGTYLTADITITAPSGFEISTSSGSGYNSSLTLSQSGCTVPSTSIYTRMKSSNAVGSYSGNVSLSSSGAATQNVYAQGSVSSNLSSVTISPAVAQTICGNSPGNTLSVTETGSAVLYRNWGKRSASGGTVTDISGESGTTFTPSLLNLGEGNWYVVCVSTPTCGVTTVSNEVYVSIHLNPTVDYISGQAYAYIDGTSTLSCSTTGGVWSSSSPSIATINQSGLVTAVSEGNTEIKYTVTTNGCTSFSNTWFSVIKYDQTISFTLDSPVELGVSPITLNGTASSGLPVSYTSSDLNVATVSGNVLTVVGAGYTTITAKQVGNGYYNAATDVQQGLEVTQKTPQTISFTLASPKTINAGTYGLNGLASSYLPVSYTSSDTSVATISGSSITIVGMGYTTITASQAGNWQYAAAPDVEQQLAVYDLVNTWIGGAAGDPSNWDVAGNWSAGEVPGIWDNASIPAFPLHQPHITAPPENPTIAYILKIYPNASLTIDPGAALTLTGSLNNQAGTSGLIIDSDSTGTGSLIEEISNVSATIKRYVTGSSNLESMAYHMVSIPLVPESNSTSSLFLGSYLYEFNTGGDYWLGLDTATTTPLDETKGYMIYAPESGHTYSFEGVLNYNYFNVSAVYEGNGNNLIPNPYPSAIDWDSPGIEKYGIANSVYMWPAGGYNYISYVDGIVIPEETLNPGIIPVGQAFFVKAIDWPNITISSSAKVHSGRSFQKSQATVKDLLRVKASANGKSDEAVIRFNDDATVNADAKLDAWKYTGLPSAPQLYTLSADSKMLSINSLPYTQDSHLVDLGFSLDSDAEVKLNFSSIGSFDPRISIHLIDIKTSQSVDLRTSNEYTFNYVKNEEAGRFKIQFAGPLGKDDLEKTDCEMWFSGQTLYISSPGMSGKTSRLTLWNTAGQEVFNTELILESLNRIPLHLTGPLVARLIQGNTILTAKGVLIK
ncbi:MAG: Ig-like domain-containing protein [Bacteroidetes bacterium]|nr:Ig-like domain-containing protein [Bacteroidota bacterium]